MSDPWANTIPAGQATPRQANASTGGILVWDNEKGVPTYILREDYAAAISSGRYRAYDESVVRTQNAAGAVQADDPALGLAHIQGGQAPVSGAADAAADVTARRRAAFDNFRDKAWTFAEGVADSFTLGLVKERGEAADIQRDVNSGSAFGGNMLGIATALLNPAAGAAAVGKATGPITKVIQGVGSVTGRTPLAKVMRGTQRLGDSASKKLLGEAVKGERAITTAGRRATSEVLSNGMDGMAFAAGHEMSDALLEPDKKPFAFENVTSTLYLDGAVGGVFGAGGALLGRARSSMRAKEFITGGEGILNASSDKSAIVMGKARQAVDGVGLALEKHVAKADAIDIIAAKEGGPEGIAWAKGRRESIDKARKTGERLKGIDIDAVLAGDDPKAVAQLLEHIDEYSDAVVRLDSIDTPESIARWAQPDLRAKGQKLVDNRRTLSGAELDEGGAGLSPKHKTFQGADQRREMAVGRAAEELPHTQLPSSSEKLDQLMTPERRADYERIYGRKYEDLDELYGPARVDDGIVKGEGGIGGERFHDDYAPPENLTNAGPNAGRRKSKSKPEPEAAPVKAEPSVPEQHLPSHQMSSLEAFAYDVQAVGGQLNKADLPSVLEAMRKRGKGGKLGKPPWSPERFQELVAEAEQAGYLATQGAKTPVDYLGMSVGDQLVITPDFATGQMPRFHKRERFGRWEDQGRSGGAPGSPTGPTLLDGNPPPMAPGSRMPTQGLPRSGDPLADALAEAPVVPQAAPGMDPLLLDEAGQYVSQRGPARSHGDEAAREIDRLMGEVVEMTGGRTGLAQAREAAVAAGLPDKARGRLSEQLAGIWGLRQLAKAAGEATKGPSARAAKGSLMEKILKRSGVAAGRAAVFGNKMSTAIAGGAAGVVGGHLMGAAMGMVGGFAASAGKAHDMVIKAGAALLSGKGSRIAAAVPRVAKYSYDGSEPTEDVAARVQQLHTVMADPMAARARIVEELGDLGTMQPDMIEAVAGQRLAQYQSIAVRAPAFIWNSMGEARPVGAQALRRFREAEDTIWNLPGLMASISGGNVTRTQAEVFREGYPEHHAVMARSIMEDKERLRNASRERKAAAELILGYSLSTHTPEYAQRQQQTFVPPEPTTPVAGAGAVKAPNPTPSQSAIAPGNR